MEIEEFQIIGDEYVLGSGSGKEPLQALGGHGVVRIEQSKPLALCLSDANVSRRGRAGVIFEPVQLNTRIGEGAAVHEIRCRIRGGIVDYDNLDVIDGL